MKQIVSIFLVTLSFGIQAQRYETEMVIDTARSYLEKAVGSELIPYFEIDSSSYYEYQNFWGKSRWERILASKKTKGKFVNAHDIRFTLNYPDFLFALKIHRTVFVKLDSVLNLEEEIKLDRIPKFILSGTSSDWLTSNQIDSIAQNQNLKKAVKDLRIHLKFNHQERFYYWMVINTLYEEKCFSDCEILFIDPVSGEILLHSEDRLYVMDCY